MKYKIYFQENGVLKNKIVSQISDIPTNTIKIKELHSPFDFQLSLYKKDSDIVTLLYEISLMLSAKIPIKDVIEILLKSHKNSFSRDILQTIFESLQNGQPIYKSLEIHKKSLGYLPILFFKLGEQNGNISNAIDSLYTILNENKKLQASIFKSLQYPILLIISICIAIGIIFTTVIPKFEHIFALFGENLPLSTSILLFIKNSIYNYSFILFGGFFGFIFLSIFIYLKYRYFFHTIVFLHIPFLSKMIQYLTFYKFFLSLYLIVHSKHKLQDALIYGKFTTSNLFFQEKIEQIIEDISEGIPISTAFGNRNCFDELTLRLLLIGENTNRLDCILEDLHHIHKKQFDTNMERFTSFLTPFFVFIFSGIILWLVLAIMTPVWEMGNFIK